MSPLAQPFDAVVFDMDGTLLDTEAVFKSIVYEVCGDLGFAMTDLVHGQMVGSSHEATAALLARTFGPKFSYETFEDRCRAAMTLRMAKSVPVKPGAVDLLAALRELDVPLAVATSSRSNHALTHLEAAGVIGLFDTIVTRDDVANPKPHPEPYLTAAARLGVEPVHCVAFEDSVSGVRAAHAAGMRTVMVPDLVRPSEEIAALCVAVLDTLAHAHEHLVIAPRTANGMQKHLHVKSRG